MVHNERARGASSTQESFWGELAREVREEFVPQGAEAIKQAWRDFVDDVTSWPRERRRELWGLGEERRAQLDVLPELDAETRERIGPQVAAAARSVEIRASWARAVYRLFFRLDVVLFWVFVFYIATLGWWTAHVITRGAPSINIWTVGGVMLVLLLVTTPLNNRVSRRFGDGGLFLVQILTVVAMVSLASRPASWQRYLDDWQSQPDVMAWHSSGKGDITVASFSLDGSIINALAASAVVKAFFILRFIILYLMQLFGPREPRRDLLCAQLLDRLLEIALALQVMTAEMAAPVQAGAMDEEDEAFERAGVGLRSYIASDGRRLLVKEAEELAELVEGRWRRAMRTGDRAGDMEINRVAEGIAARLRHWKTVAAVGGPELEAMRGAFTAAVVNAADGDWKSMAAEISGRDLLSRRLGRWARRLAAVVVLVGTWALMTVKPFTWIETVEQAGLTAVAYVFAIGVATTLDPAAHDRVMGAIRQSGDFKDKAA
ncbi:hypothetical protein ACFYUY_34900 [Kitasatospora sp. NPDC004745]|uniref:hypothetical protein n=1 Tax=Kitasatospora sp. NPDC004745 TaxID=3364019 RepID=UPI0036B34B59